MTWKCPKCGREFGKKDQSHYCEKPVTMDDYIRQQKEEVQPKLNEIRTIIQTAIPEAEERISWSMPTYWKGKNIIHFAASKNQLGLYPGDEATEEFSEELKEYATSKGTIRFLYTKPLPVDLIRRIARWCLEHYGR